jgi:hypothetical protein
MGVSGVLLRSASTARRSDRRSTPLGRVLDDWDDVDGVNEVNDGAGAVRGGIAAASMRKRSVSG